MIFIFTGKKSLVSATTTCLELIPKADWKNKKTHTKKETSGSSA